MASAASSEAETLQIARSKADQIALAEQLAWKALIAESKSNGVFNDPKGGAGVLQTYRRPFQRAGSVSARLFGSTPTPAPVPVATLPLRAIETTIQEITLRQPLRPKASTADRDFAIVFTLKAIIDACSQF